MDSRDEFEEALKKYALENGLLEDGQIIVNYVLMASVVGSDADLAGYFGVMADGQPPHVTLGLLDYAQNIERSGLFFDDGDFLGDD